MCVVECVHKDAVVYLNGQSGASGATGAAYNADAEGCNGDAKASTLSSYAIICIHASCATRPPTAGRGTRCPSYDFVRTHAFAL